jgi:uncharacterized protein YqiB (DUF1249 family)
MHLDTQLSSSSQDKLNAFIDHEKNKVVELIKMLYDNKITIESSSGITIGINSIPALIDSNYDRLKALTISIDENKPNYVSIYANIKASTKQIIESFTYTTCGGLDHLTTIFILTTYVNKIFDVSIHKINNKINELMSEHLMHKSIAIKKRMHLMDRNDDEQNKKSRDGL